MNQTKANLRQKLSHPPWHDWPMAKLLKLLEITYLVWKIRRSNDFISGSERAKWGWWEPPLAFLHFSTCQPVTPLTPSPSPGACVGPWRNWVLVPRPLKRSTKVKGVLVEGVGIRGFKIWGFPEPTLGFWIGQSTSGFHNQVNVRSHDS